LRYSPGDRGDADDEEPAAEDPALGAAPVAGEEARRRIDARGARLRALKIVNADLIRAIVDRYLVEFVYNTGGSRIVEPHDYGIQRGVESLLGFQLGGESRSGMASGWKHFKVARIRQLRVLDRHFAGTRADSAQHHRTWDTLFARVT
jgi:predicted DNA-binding transcriptional regulator YafY